MNIDLIKAYADVEMLQSLDLPIPDEKKETVNRLEKQFLKEELEPFAGEMLKFLLKGFRSDVNISIKYDAESGNVTINGNTIPSLKSKRGRKPRTTIEVVAQEDERYYGDDDFTTVYLKSSTLKASGHYNGSEFIVHKGSQVSTIVTQSARKTDEREYLLKQNAKLEGDVWVTVNDLSFASPSAAAVFCFGRSANGWLEWVDKYRQPLKSVAQKK